MQVKTLWLAVILLTMETIQPGQAGSAAKEIPDAQALIDACWTISLEDRSSGNTPRMRNGALETVLCLEKVILDQVDILFPDGKYMSRKKAQEHLVQISFGLGKLYWSIYNEHIGCDISCGTMFHVMHLPPIADALEDMIRVMISQRQEYGL